MSIIFFTSRMLAMLILVMLATSFIIAIVALEPYIPKITPPCPCPHGQQGVEAAEGLAPAWTWQFEAPITAGVECDGKVGDPWGGGGHEIFSANTLACGLPNVQVASLTSNLTHYNIICAFIPHAATITTPHRVVFYVYSTNYGGLTHTITEITWTNLDTTRVYRYMMTWPRGTITTFAENQLSRIRVEQEILPRWINMTMPTDTSQLHICYPGTSVVVRGPAGNVNTFTSGTTISRINSTHLLLRLTVSFTAAAQVQQIEWIRTRGNCNNWLGDHLVMRVTFVDANNNPRTINVNVGDVFTFEKYIALRQR